MDAIIVLLGLVVGIAIFLFFMNQVTAIVYHSKSILRTFLVCWGIGIVLAWIAWKLALIIAVIALILFIISKITKTEDTNNNSNSEENNENGE